jgi:O-antigen ligase
MSRVDTLRTYLNTPQSLGGLFFLSTTFLITTWLLNDTPDVITELTTFNPYYVIPHYALLILLSLLFALTILILYKRYKLNITNNTTNSTAGIASFLAVLGGGCAGCFAGVFPALMSFFGIGFSLLNLPLLGTELLLASCAIYLGTIYYLLKPIQCELKPET